MPFFNRDSIFQIQHPEEFERLTLQLFQFQHIHNKVYREYCDLLSVDPEKISSITEIPFLPVSFFKTHRVVTTQFQPEKIFYSSSTGGIQPSQHEVKELSLYEKSFINAFTLFYGDPAKYTILALLPGYLERENSSLVYMMNELIKQTGKEESGFYLYNYQDVYNILSQLKLQKRETILFGVTFALLDLVEKWSIDFPELTIFETGGMKGRRPELVKDQIHNILKERFGVSSIHSEYGMCELLSQAYSYGDNLFQTPPWMKLLLRDERDPFNISDKIEKGVINVIDLANVYSCAFIATDDLGKMKDEKIEIIGRLDQAEIRGCNLLVGDLN